MYYYNILKPRFICDNAIRFISKEKSKVLQEIEELRTKQGLENHLKIAELSQLNYEYYVLINELEQLAKFAVQQMETINYNNQKEGECIL